MRRNVIMLLTGVLVGILTLNAMAAREGEATDTRTQTGTQPQTGVGQTGTQPGQQTGLQAQPGQERAENIRFAKDLMGLKVVSSDDQNVGEVHDLVLSGDRSTISYVAVAAGGVLGIGEKLIAVPVDAVRMVEKDRLVLDVSQDRIKQAPGFDKNAWPSQPNEKLTQDISAFYEKESAAYKERAGQRTAADTRTSADMRRASKLIGLKLQDAQNNDIGKLEDMAVDLRERRVALAIVSRQDKAQWSAVPWKTIQVDPAEKAVTFTGDRNRLDQIVFESRQRTDVASRDFIRRVYQTFGEEPYWGTYGFEGRDRDKMRDQQQKDMPQKDTQQKDTDVQRQPTTPPQRTQ